MTMAIRGLDLPPSSPEWRPQEGEQEQRAPLPPPRGPLSAYVLDLLGGPARTAWNFPTIEDDPLIGDDLQLALYACYELHYSGFAGVDDAWEWEPSLIGFRRALERTFDRAIGELVSVPRVTDALLGQQLHLLVEGAQGSGLDTFLASESSISQFKEFVMHRSAYQLKEADPHTWALPRLRGGAKAALVEIQIDEYGRGDASRMHASMFAELMKSLGLDSTPNAYVGELPGSTLATANLVSRFGLHRATRGELVGHLAAFEMTSSESNRRYGQGLRRLLGRDAPAGFYDEHVEADSVHEMIAAFDLAGGLGTQEPGLREPILFGANACLMLETLAGRHMLSRWNAGASSLFANQP
jgi:hypothetical protein